MNPSLDPSDPYLTFEQLARILNAKPDDRFYRWACKIDHVPLGRGRKNQRWDPAVVREFLTRTTKRPVTIALTARAWERGQAS